MKTRKFYFSVICCALALILCLSGIPVQAAQKADANTALAQANTSAASTLSAIHADTNLADEMKIRQIITLLFDVKRDIFANEGLYDFDFSVFGEVNETKGADLLYFARSAAAERKLVLAFGNYPGDCETDLNFKSIQIDGNTATVNVYEWLSFYYYFPDTGKADFDSGMGFNYVIELKKSTSGWKITGIDFENSATERLRDASISVDTFVQDQYQTVMTQETIAEPIAFGPSANARSTASVITLNRAKACGYASTYGGTARNPNFYDCTPNDCQNFASQCLWYGLGGETSALSSAGLPMINPTNAGSTGRAWYIFPNGAHSASWTSVNSFYSYIINGSSSTVGLYGYVYSDVANAYLADIVQGTGDGSSYIHSYIVTNAFGTAGSRTAADIYVNSHTSDLKNAQLSCRGNNSLRTICVNGIVTP